jgi:hypothetical protein
MGNAPRKKGLWVAAAALSVQTDLLLATATLGARIAPSLDGRVRA